MFQFAIKIFKKHTRQYGIRLVICQKKWLNSETLYNKYKKTKIRAHSGKINTNFQDNKITE